MEAIDRTAGEGLHRDASLAGRGGPWSRLGARLVGSYLSRLRHGRIVLDGPAVDTMRAFGDPAAELSATLTVHRPRFFHRTVAGGDVGFAEAYMDGDWDCDRLADLIFIFAANRDELDDLSLATAIPRRLLDRLYHLRRRNTLAGNRRNIQDHYDLGNEFFGLFLDPTMTYSCGLFPTGHESLEAAQQLKIRTVLDKADLRSGQHILEIGSGWGSLAIEAARRHGCRVTTLTLSDQQKVWVERAVAAAGLADRIEVRIDDYRTIAGQFDRIVSVEMLEAVGHENLPRYFAACDRLLRPGGTAVIQVITIRDELYEDYRKGCDFIQRYIFPGGHLPCWQALAGAVKEASSLRVGHVEDIGHHYATTLAAWRDAFNGNTQRLFDMGFDRTFRRRWNYYFSYCEAGFRARSLGTLQIVLGK